MNHIQWLLIQCHILRGVLALTKRQKRLVDMQADWISARLDMIEAKFVANVNRR
mgnify:CR=1 FL=1